MAKFPSTLLFSLKAVMQILSPGKVCSCFGKERQKVKKELKALCIDQLDVFLQKVRALVSKYCFDNLETRFREY